MNNPRAIASVEKDEDVELTTRPLLSSGQRLKARPVSPTEADEIATERPPPDDAAGQSVARVAVSSSVRSSQLGSAVDSVAPIRVTPEHAKLGPYQVVCELASGGMATVYLALYRSVEGFEKLCAVKRIHPHLANDREFTNMFADEAQIAARISHPFVCSVFSFGRSQHSHFIAMEFLRGEPLSAVMRRVARSAELGDDPRFPAFAARLLANFAEGLHAAHTLRDDRGALLEVVHRDVTPQNLFVLYDGTVRVTDFGIAHARRRLHQTEGQKLKGKLSYVAPEQLNQGKVDARVDVWGLGVTLWELLAGRRLFLGSSEGETLSAVMARVVQPPSAFRATVPAELDRIVLRALERDVQKRYRSARDMSRDLERFLNTIGDQVPSMDVADWMSAVFPQGGERMQTLIEMAARVSAATADETVVRVPSVPPPSGGAASSFVVPVAPDLSLPPPPSSTVPDRAPRPEPVSTSLPAVLTVPPRLLPGEPTSSSAAPQVPPARPAIASKPRLMLVEESTHGRDWTEPGHSLRWAVLVSASLLAVGVGSYLLRARARVLSETTQTAAAVTKPVALDVAEVPVSAESKPVANQPEVASAPLAIDALPLEAERKAPVIPRVSSPVPAAAPAAPAASEVAVAPTGVVLVTTPGGSGQVYEQGRLLGPAPGSFRLSVGAHELSLQTPSGASLAVHVEIKRDAPTLVTVNGAQ